MSPDRDTNSKASPLLSPAQRASEIVFGVIMALSITAAISVGGVSRDTTRELLLAALACNVAWGMVDAAMYLINTLVDRARRRKVARDLLQTSTDENFLALLVQTSDVEMARTLSHGGARNLRRWLERYGHALPSGLRLDDWLAALQIWLLVFASTLPLVVPFLVVDEPRVALRLSQVIAIAMLFGLGIGLGRWVGAKPVAFGVSFAAVGAAITGACIALGG
jgi:hypothetical protein